MAFGTDTARTTSTSSSGRNAASRTSTAPRTSSSNSSDRNGRTDQQIIFDLVGSKPLTTATMLEIEPLLPQYGMRFVWNADHTRPDVVGSDGGQYDFVFKMGSRDESEMRLQWEQNRPAGFHVSDTPSGTAPSNPNSGPGATPGGYTEGGVARNADGTLDVEGTCAARGGEPFASPSGYHRCSSPITGTAIPRPDPFALDLNDIIAAGQRQARDAAIKERRKMMFGGRQSTILTGFRSGTPASRRATILGSKGRFRAATADREPFKPKDFSRFSTSSESTSNTTRIDRTNPTPRSSDPPTRFPGVPPEDQRPPPNRDTGVPDTGDQGGTRPPITGGGPPGGPADDGRTAEPRRTAQPRSA